MADVCRKKLGFGVVAEDLGEGRWRRCLIAAEMANAAYGGGASLPGEKQPRVGNVTSHEAAQGQKIPNMKDAEFAQVADLILEFKSSNVLKSLFVTNYDTDTEAWVGAYRPKEPPGSPLHIFVAFRGTSTFYDCWTDAKFFKERGAKEKAEAIERWTKRGTLDRKTYVDIGLHCGFFHQYESVQQKIGDLVTDLTKLANDGPWDLLVTGHSMGGALARICCFDLLSRGIAKTGQTELITIGSGPAGNKVFCDALDDLLGVDTDPGCNMHFVENNDPIPKLASRGSKGGCCSLSLLATGTGAYAHGGCLAWFDFDGGLQDAREVWRVKRLCAYVCAGASSKINFPMFDHPPCQYIKHIGAQYQLKTKSGTFKAKFPDACLWDATKLTFTSLQNDGLDGILREVNRYCGVPAAESGFKGYAEAEAEAHEVDV